MQTSKSLKELLLRNSLTENQLLYFRNILDCAIDNKIEELSKLESEDPECQLVHYDSAAEWAINARMFYDDREKKLKPYSYFRLEPWIPFHHDTHSDRLARKCRQVTASEQANIIKVHYLRENPYRDSLHTFHQRQAALDFSKKRTAQMIRQSPELQKAQRSRALFSRSFEFREGDEQFDYYAGTRQGESDEVAGAAVLGKSPGFIIFDERQSQDSMVRTYVEMALGFKRDAKTLTIGTSRTPGNPLELEYQQSDQKVCLYRCPKCKHWFQPIITLDGRTWNCENIRKLNNPIKDDWGYDQNYIMICDQCGHDMDYARGRYGKLDDGTRIEWVHQKKGTDGKAYRKYYSGYYFSRFEAGVWSIDETIKDIEDINRSPRDIANEILGLPYAGSDNPFPMDLINRCKWNSMSFSDALTLKYKLRIGCADWGERLGTTCGIYSILPPPDNRIVLCGLKNIEGEFGTHGIKAAEWFADHQCDIVLADWGYRGGREKHLRDKFGADRVFLIQYEPSPKQDKTMEDWRKIDANLAAREGLVKVIRNYAIEQFSFALSAGLRYFIIPYKYPEACDKWLAEFTNIVRVDPDEKRTLSLVEIKKQNYIYAKSGDDHTAHICIYASLVHHPDLRDLFERKVRVY